MASLNPYGKLSEADQERLVARRKTRRRITIIAISSVLLVAVVVAACVGVSQTKDNKSSGATARGGVSSSLKAFCGVTLYPDSCYTSLSPLVKSRNIKPQDLFKLSVQVTINELSKASNYFLENGVRKLNITNETTLAAVESCRELFSLSLDHLNDSMSVDDVTVPEAVYDLRTWLSSAVTYQQTCIDELDSAGAAALSSFASENFKNCTEYSSNSLAFISSIDESIDALGNIGRRRLMSSDDAEWLSVAERRLLQTPSAKIEADAVVAKDGSGKYKTIAAALKKVPEKSEKRFVIYVKKGVYVENVRVEKKMWNVMMVGDGKDATIVSGSLNVIDGTPTFQSATFGNTLSFLS